MKSAVRVLFAGLLIMPGSSAARLAAQTPLIRVPLDSGTLLRMTPQTGAPFEGRLVASFPASGTVLHTCRYPGPPCNDPRDSISVRHVDVAALMHIEVQHGNHADTGALIGGLIGTILFAAGGSLAQAFCDAENCGPSAAVITLRGAFGGAIVGALIGSTSPRWRPLWE